MRSPSLVSHGSFFSRGLPGTLCGGLLLSVLLLAPSPAPAAPLHVDLAKESSPPGHSRRIRLRLSIVPAPAPSRPVHLHVYLDGRMILMRSFTSSPATIALPRLSPGHHEVTVVEADSLTHKEKGGENSMAGMEMGGMEHMEGMDMGKDGGDARKGEGRSSPRGSLGRLVLDVAKD